MSLLKIGRTPAVTVPLEASVLDAVRAMDEKHIGAVAIVHGEKLAGIFTERDLMTRVVLRGHDPKGMPISEVMTPNVEAAKDDMALGDALRMMVERHFRHLPIVDKDRRVLGMLSLRHLLKHRIEDLSTELDSVVSYFAADGIGG